jgi:phosphoenolpyruvate carboxykinase (GTP)
MNTMPLELKPAAPAARRHVSPGELANAHVKRFVHRALKLCVPDRIYWCNGSAFERRKLTEQAVCDGLPTEPQPMTRAAAPPPADALPDTDPAATYRLFDHCMAGRTMYVVPFLAGRGPEARVGVQITDSLAVVLGLFATTQVGDAALGRLGDRDDFARRLDATGDGDPGRRVVRRLPLDDTLYTFNVGAHALPPLALSADAP